MTITETRTLRDRALTEHAEEQNRRMVTRLEWVRRVEAESASRAIHAVRQVLPSDVVLDDGHTVAVLGTDENTTTCELEVDGIWFRVAVYHHGAPGVQVLVEGIPTNKVVLSWKQVCEELANGCPMCHGRLEVDLPKSHRYGPDEGDIDGDIEEHPCPLCRPWSQGFPGYKQNDVELISAYGPGERGTWLPAEPF